MPKRVQSHSYAMSRWLDLSQPMPVPKFTIDQLVRLYWELKKAYRAPVDPDFVKLMDARIKNLREKWRVKDKPSQP